MRIPSAKARLWAVAARRAERGCFTPKPEVWDPWPQWRQSKSTGRRGRCRCQHGPCVGRSCAPAWRAGAAACRPVQGRYPGRPGLTQWLVERCSTARTQLPRSLLGPHKSRRRGAGRGRRAPSRARALLRATALPPLASGMPASPPAGLARTRTWDGRRGVEAGRGNRRLVRLSTAALLLASGSGLPVGPA